MTKNDKPQEKNEMSRRNFLELAWITSLIVFAGEILGMLSKFIQPVTTGGFGGIVKAGSVNSFPVGSITFIKEGRFYVYRLEDGSFLALWQRCTHLGCSIPWNDTEKRFHCPCHGSLFNEVGEVEGGPAPRPMDIFPITIENGELYVDTGNPIERKAFDSSQTTQL